MCGRIKCRKRSWTVEIDSATAFYGEYHEQDTDISISVGSVTFDFSRTYDREDAKKWFFSVESEISPYSTYCVREGMTWYLLYEYPLIRQVILPDKTELMLIAEAEGRPFTDSTGDWTLTYQGWKRHAHVSKRACLYLWDRQ